MIKKRPSPKKYKRNSTYIKRFSFPASATRRKVRGVDRDSFDFFKFFKKILKKVFVLCLLVCAVILIFRAYNYAKTYLCEDERFFVEDIEVVGCNNLTETEIKNLVPFKIGDNMLMICLSDTKKQLQEQKPELKNISLTRNWKEKKILISLEERTPEVFIFKGESKIGLDFDDKPFSLRGNMFDMSIPVLTYSDKQERVLLLNFFKQFKKYMADYIPDIKEIKHGEVEDIILKMNDKTICWGQIQYKKIEEKAEKLKKVLNDLNGRGIKAEYIDLSLIDNNKERIIVKAIPEEEEQQLEISN